MPKTRIWLILISLTYLTLTHEATQERIKELIGLAYRIVQELANRWNQINLTVEEGVHELTTLCATEVLVEGEPRCNKIPQPRPSVKRLLKAASVCLRGVLLCKGIRVASRKKLPENRATP